MNKNNAIKPWYFIFKSLVYNKRPFSLSKAERFFLSLILMFFFVTVFSQNKLQKQLSAEHIETITIDGKKTDINIDS